MRHSCRINSLYTKKSPQCRPVFLLFSVPWRHEVVLPVLSSSSTVYKGFTSSFLLFSLKITFMPSKSSFSFRSCRLSPLTPKSTKSTDKLCTSIVSSLLFFSSSSSFLPLASFVSRNTKYLVHSVSSATPLYSLVFFCVR